MRSALLALVLAALAAVGVRAACAQVEQSERPVPADRAPAASDSPGIPADVFHPDYDPEDVPEPEAGGRVILHVSSLPKHVNYMTENSATSHEVLFEVHEFLLQKDWETLEWYSPLTVDGSFAQEDALILKDGERVFGRVSEEGEGYRLVPASPRNPHEKALYPKTAVETFLPGTVFTFVLRDDIKWHDGHPFDARDVVFSFEAYKNPHVDCGHMRFKFEHLTEVDVLDGSTLRFFRDEPYFLAVDAFSSLCILPSHRYDLKDPDNPERKPDATAEEQGAYINEHPNNKLWIGLGPYRVTEWGAQSIDAERFDDYYDPARAGYLDGIRWRYVAGDAVPQALLNEEFDFTTRISTDDYFGALTSREEFTDTFYKGYFYVGYMNYIGWNLRRPLFKDVRVRQALARCFDWDAFLRTTYHGLGERVTAAEHRFGPNYDDTIEPIPFDLEKAELMLAEAGWYDRDGDGVIEKDGIPFAFEYLVPQGNPTSASIAQQYQANLAKVGIKLEIVTREWAAFLEARKARDFDAYDAAWTFPVEGDPHQKWHSSGAKEGSNHVGLVDAEVDRLIETIQVTLDPGARRALFSKLQRRIYDLQPYNFGVIVPMKFAMNRDVRGMQLFKLRPGYSVRRWWRTD